MRTMIDGGRREMGRLAGLGQVLLFGVAVIGLLTLAEQSSAKRARNLTRETGWSPVGDARFGSKSNRLPTDSARTSRHDDSPGGSRARRTAGDPRLPSAPSTSSPCSAAPRGPGTHSVYLPSDRAEHASAIPECGSWRVMLRSCNRSLSMTG